MKIICDCGRHYDIVVLEKPKRPFWSRQSDKQLGKIPDKIIADRLGCTVKAVERRRERLGIKTPTRFR